MLSADGVQHFTQIADGAKLPDGAASVPRAPADAERWDFTASVFVKNVALAADMAVPASHIATAHTIKQIEASLILSGVRLTHGLLVEEAAALGMPLATLAAQVEAKAAEFRAMEVERRTMKQGAGSE